MWRPVMFAALAAVLLSSAPAPVEGRQVERESQVPIAPSSDIVEIAQELRSRLNLFPEVEEPLTGRLFQRDDGSFILELAFVRADRLQRERRTLTSEAVEELRDEIARRIALTGEAEQPQLSILDHSGRGRLVLGQTLLGLGYHGWAVPLTLDIDSGQGIVATYLLTAGTTFYLSYRLSRHRPVSDVHSDLAFYGGSRGIVYGALVGDAALDRDDDTSDRVRLGTGVAMGVGGSLLGHLAADRIQPNEEQAALWRVLGDFGLLGGAAVAYASGPYASRDIIRGEGDLQYVDSERRNRRLGHALTILGGAGGLVAGRWLGDRQLYTEGNVHVLRSAGILGAQTGMTVTRALGAEGSRTIVGGALLGGVFGIAGGHRFLDGKRFSSGEGLLVNAGHLAGGISALGATYLLVEDIDEHPLLYMGTSTVGSLLGAGLVRRALGEGSDATVTLHPENLLFHRATGKESPALPLVTVRF